MAKHVKETEAEERVGKHGAPAVQPDEPSEEEFELDLESVKAEDADKSADGEGESANEESDQSEAEGQSWDAVKQKLQDLSSQVSGKIAAKKEAAAAAKAAAEEAATPQMQGSHGPVTPSAASYGYTAANRATRNQTAVIEATRLTQPQAAAWGQVVIDDHRRRTRRRWRIVFWVAMAVLLACVAVLGYIFFGYWTGQQNYSKAVEESGFTKPLRESQAVLSEMTVDWDALRASNSDIVAWIYIPGTNIDYPVVQGKDNDEYLHTDFYGTKNAIVSVGSIFLDYQNAKDFSDANNVLYGHHLNDGTMFSAIAEMASQSKFDDARVIYLLTPNGNYKLRTFSLIHCAADDPLVQTTFASAEEQASYIQDKIGRTVVDVDDVPDVSAMTKTFALSTCDNSADNGRYVLFAYVTDTSVEANVVEEVAQAAQEVS